MAQPDDSARARTRCRLRRSRPAAAPSGRRGGFLPGLIGGLLGGAVVTAGGGWYAYEHGPVKPALSSCSRRPPRHRMPRAAWRRSGAAWRS